MSNLYRAHLEWARRAPDERFQSMDALATAVKERRQGSIEANVSKTDLGRMQATVDAQGNLRIGGQRPTHWAFGQVCSLVGAPAEYLREIPRELASENLNHGIRNRLVERDSNFGLLTGANGDTTLRAITSGKYARLWDAEVVDAVQRLAGDFRQPMCYGDGKFGQEKVPSGLYASDRDMFAFLINEDAKVEVGGELLGRGFYTWNSEVGSKTWGFASFLYRFVCGNSIIWGADRVFQARIRHVGGGAREGLRELFPRALDELRKGNVAKSELEAIRDAIKDRAAKNPDEAREYLSEKGFTRTEAAGGVDAAIREERDPFTRWSLCQGLTAFAREYPHIDQRVDLERRAAAALLPVLKN
jgi:hypothetical protein